MWVLTWWLVPFTATLIAIGVMAVLGRCRGPGPSDRSVEEFQRFRSALEHQVYTAPYGASQRQPDQPDASEDAPRVRRG